MMRTVIEFVKGDLGPTYKDAVQAELKKVVVTEKGTNNGLPIVDFVMQLPSGETVLLVLTGRIVNAIAAGVKGANLRNHGVAEP